MILVPSFVGTYYRYSKRALLCLEKVEKLFIQSFPLKKTAVGTADLSKHLQTYEGQCIMYDQLVYRVEKGKKRLYPDWESVQAAKCPLNQLTQDELDHIPAGEGLASVLDKEQLTSVEILQLFLVLRL